MSESISFWIPPDFQHAPGQAPIIESYAGSVPGFGIPQLTDSLQAEANSAVILSWTISGDADVIEIDGAGPLRPADRTVTVQPAADRDYLLVVKNRYGAHQAKVHVSVHAK